MTYFDAQLQLLRQQLQRRDQLASMVKELRSQRTYLAARVEELEKIKLEEQSDVEQLEGHSLAAFFYHVIGKMDERLNAEREEAYAAKVKYDAAFWELEAAKRELYRCETELVSLRDCDRQYEAALKEKADAVKAAGGAAAQKVLQLEEQLASLEAQKKELREAVRAGVAAFDFAERILSGLHNAMNWGTWDLMGGGLVADVAKYSYLDQAQREIGYLQSQLRKFKTELADVAIHADIEINVDGFLRFADCFFDGLFADWAVMDRISESRKQVQNTSDEIADVLSRLDAVMISLERKREQVKSELDMLIAEAPC